MLIISQQITFISGFNSKKKKVVLLIQLLLLLLHIFLSSESDPKIDYNQILT
jgi:hypothetical protein